MNKEYNFTLKYKLPVDETANDELAERLYANNCDDALIGIGMPKRIALEFIREASSAEAAIYSAHQDVMNTLPDAELIEALPDYVGMTDIASIVNVSRQQIRKLYNQNLYHFPSPVHEGKNTLWHLAPVLEWIAANTKYVFDDTLIEVAKQTAQLNRARSGQKNEFKRAMSYHRVLQASLANTYSPLVTLFDNSVDANNHSQLAEAV